MKQSKPYERLLARLSELHAGAVPREKCPTVEARERLSRAINQSKRHAQSSSIDEERPWFSRGLAWRLALPAAALAAAGAALLARPSLHVEIHPEPAVSSVAASAIPTHLIAQPYDPCEHALRAQGSQGLIDDFEDANPLISPEEGRVALWSLFRDTDSPGANSTLVPKLRPQSSRTNRYALQAQGGELRNWGAVIQIPFMPSCYDASAYDGITFSAKGPGRLYAGAREVRTVPAEYGGTCAKDCYNAHQKKIELSSQWRTYSVKWSEMYQRGYNQPAFDPARLNSLSFAILPGDTPFDIWLDDVKFVEKR
jgi:hypothetical protein